MKFNKKVMATVLLASTAAVLASCGSGKEKITIWVSEVAGVSDSFKTLAQKYVDDNGLNYEVNVVGVTEAESATQMLTDVSAGADIYCFAQDQFARLVQGGALAKLGTSAASFVKDNNTSDSVTAASSGTDIYAYPLTADNGYFMYYDKSVITDTSHLDSLESLIDDCEKAGRKFSMEMGTSAWYLAAFFMAYEDGATTPLCHSNWTTDSNGKFTSVDDNYYSDNGVIAAKGVQKLVKSEMHESSSKAADFNAATKSAILVSGTWVYNDVKEILGDNMGVADLPSYTVNGKSYHLGSYSGYKLMGVKPQQDATKQSNLHKLAQYLTNYDAQMSRLNAFGWGPSNKVAQGTDEYKANPALVALSEQNKYATPQGQIHGSWWDIAKVIATDLKDADGTDDAINKVLKSYKEKIDKALSMTDEQRRAFTVIGKIASQNCDWNTDIEMVESPTNTWTTKDAILLAEGDEFKCRQGLSWDLAYGEGDGNFNITAENAGTKKIQLVTTVDADGNVTGGTISLVD